MKAKTHKTIFICQVTDSVLKVVKLQPNGGPEEIAPGLKVYDLGPGAESLSEKIKQAFKELEYKNQRVVLSLPRGHAACRHLKVPAQSQGEIEKIVSLQAAAYLPYPANELITGFQVISTDKEGYSFLNLIIVHQGAIERYLRIFKELKITDFGIFLNSYGIVNLYHYLNPQEAQPVMLLDLDLRQAELVVTARKKVIFSRAFKFDPRQPGWEEIFVAEINKTVDACRKEVPGPEPAKIILLGGSLSAELQERLSGQLNLSWETLPYGQRFKVAPENSFAGLIGLGLSELPESLNLLPQVTREAHRLTFRRAEGLRLALYVLAIMLILSAATAKSLDNKRQYIKRLKTEISRLAKEARPLEDIENRLRIAQDQGLKRPSGLDVFHELHRIMPASVSLSNLSYSEGGRVVIRGQAPELDAVFSFVACLEKSAVFKPFSSKVKYATRKKTQAGEAVDFEVACERAE